MKDLVKEFLNRRWEWKWKAENRERGEESVMDRKKGEGGEK